ncbi:MAG: serine/threonine-protein kinase [Pirellulaceae bacterium]
MAVRASAAVADFAAEFVEAKPQQVVLSELILLDIDYRRRLGEAVTAEDYTSEFPEHADTIRRLIPSLDGETHMIIRSTPRDSDASPKLGITDHSTSSISALGRYVALEKLGVGGFATVYRAYDQSLQRDVAVKVPHAHRADRYDLERYLAEARLVARLDHPAIVPVYDAGRTPDGTFYVVSKLIQGQNLADVLRESTLTIERSLAIIRRVGQAIDYAHHKGLVHRDLKPANILIDPRGNAFVTDFGLAIELDTPSARDGLQARPRT